VAAHYPRFETRRWTRREYDRLIDLGILNEDEPIELVQGHMVVREPKSDPHERAIEFMIEALRRVFGKGWRIRGGGPLALDPDSEPEPDVSVVRGPPPRDVGHPSRAALVVEIAKSSLAFDRTLKAEVYARMGVADYWIVNLVDRVVEIYREPVRAGRTRAYRVVSVARPGERIAPLAAPHARIVVDDLLP
jgi:Uma2 family endonuclease